MNLDEPYYIVWEKYDSSEENYTFEFDWRSFGTATDALRAAIESGRGSGFKIMKEVEFDEVKR